MVIGLGWSCAVCGWDGFKRSPWEDGRHEVDVCSCCGFKFGISDFLAPSEGPGVYKQWRSSWLAERAGAWSGSWQAPPPRWDRAAQVAAIERDAEGFESWFAMAVRGVMPVIDQRTCDGTSICILGTDSVSTQMVLGELGRIASRAETGERVEFRLTGADGHLAELESQLPVSFRGCSVRRRTITHQRADFIVPATDGSPWAEAVVSIASEMAAALRKRGYQLDFSFGSLCELERVLDARFGTDNPFPPGLDVWFGLTAYLGEVIRRDSGGTWIGPASPLTRDYGLGLQLADGSQVWPRQRLSKRVWTTFDNGDSGRQEHALPFQEAVRSLIAPYMDDSRELYSIYAYAIGLGSTRQDGAEVLEVRLSSEANGDSPGGDSRRKA